MRVEGFLMDMYCDQDGCEAFLELGTHPTGTPNKTSCMKWAKSNGWYSGISKDYCPKHNQIRLIKTIKES